MGRVYARGHGVPKNRAEATKWYKRAAEQGNDDAKKELRNLGATPTRPATSEESEVAKLQRLAHQGDAVAQYNLGKMYQIGERVPTNYAEALKWYKKAAETRIRRGSK